jgi:hypothetical protein
MSFNFVLSQYQQKMNSNITQCHSINFENSDLKSLYPCGSRKRRHETDLVLYLYHKSFNEIIQILYIYDKNATFMFFAVHKGHVSDQILNS